MRTVGLALVWLGCADPGRQSVRLDIELQAMVDDLSFDGGTVTLRDAQLHVGHLVLREALDLDVTTHPFDGRQTNPIEVGAVGATWSETRDVDLVGTRGGVLATIDGYEGSYAWASFWIGPSPRDVYPDEAMPTAVWLEGTTQLASGDLVSFDVRLENGLEVVRVPVEIALTQERPTARLQWTLDLGVVLAQLPWEAWVAEGTITEATATVPEAVRFGLGLPGAWSMEVQ